jgi:DNA-binding transcriptional LysR family regulator
MKPLTSYTQMDTEKFNWNLIPSFLAAHEHGSLLAAARALGTSQPTVGRHVSELETQLGSVLFERTGRGLAPTPAGQRLAKAARAMETGALALLRSVNHTKATLEGSVRISASQPVACALLPPVLARMRQSLPGILVELVASNAVSNLLRREADIALRMVQPNQSSLIAKRIGSVAAVPHVRWTDEAHRVITHSVDIRQILGHIGVESEPPKISPARGPPLWDDFGDAHVGEGAQIDPDWDLAAQPAPDDEVDQRINW